MEYTNIYILEDPETLEVRYVGKANNINQRYKAHLNRARKHQTHKWNWIQSLKKKGLKPNIIVIDKVPIDEWRFWETYWIQQFTCWGFNLTNYMGGGQGLDFANQTSFKKGQSPWNDGLARTQKCIVCKKEFKAPESAKRKYCSRECYHEDLEDVESRFSKGHEPWNKGISGYSTSKKGYKMPQETKDKISKTLKGKPSKKKRKVKQYDKDMNFIKEYPSITEAVEKTGINSIRNAVTGRAKTAGGYIWL